MGAKGLVTTPFDREYLQRALGSLEPNEAGVFHITVSRNYRFASEVCEGDGFDFDR